MEIRRASGEGRKPGGGEMEVREEQSVGVRGIVLFKRSRTESPPSLPGFIGNRANYGTWLNDPL